MGRDDQVGAVEKCPHHDRESEANGPERARERPGCNMAHASSQRSANRSATMIPNEHGDVLFSGDLRERPGKTKRISLDAAFLGAN